MVERPSNYRERLIEQPGQPVSAELLKNYITSVRDYSRDQPKLIDITVRGHFGRIFAGDPKKILETSLDALGKNHLNLDAAYDLALAAQRAQWYPLAKEALEYIATRSKVFVADPKRKKEINFLRGAVFEALKDHESSWKILREYESLEGLSEEEKKLVKDSQANNAGLAFVLPEEGKEGKSKPVTSESDSLHNPVEQQKAKISELESKINTGNDSAVENAASELAGIFRRAGNYIGAVEVIERALAKKDSSDLHRLRIEISLQGIENGSWPKGLEGKLTGDYKANFAVDQYKWLVERTGRSEDALLYGKSLYELGILEKSDETKRDKAKERFVEAIPYLQRRFQSENEILESMLLKTDCFLEINLEEAAAFIAEGVLRRVGDKDERKDERVRARYALARAKEAMGKIDEAKVEYARVLAEDIDFKDAKERIKIKVNPQN